MKQPDEALMKASPMKYPRSKRQKKQKRSAMNTRLPLTAVFLAAALTLGACGGGGGGGSGGPPPSSGLSDSSDPRVARLGKLLERADTLRMSGLHARWSLSAPGEETIEDTFDEAVRCTGVRCDAADGTATTVRDLLDPSANIDPDTIAAALGTRGGFDTVTTRGGFRTTETLPGLTVSVSPAVTGYGFWGDHGYAALALSTGPVTAEIEGTSYSGDFSMAQGYVAGDATGSNPSGTGSATWTGIAEASPADTNERLMGTATVTIADLSRPRVGVAIEVPGHAIGAPGWRDMRLANGVFSSGTSGRDYLEGAFHGPGHEEAWGVFDTADHVGVFGARRQP